MHRAGHLHEARDRDRRSRHSGAVRSHHQPRRAERFNQAVGDFLARRRGRWARARRHGRAGSRLTRVRATWSRGHRCQTGFAGHSVAVDRMRLSVCPSDDVEGAPRGVAFLAAADVGYDGRRAPCSRSPDRRRRRRPRRRLPCVLLWILFDIPTDEPAADRSFVDVLNRQKPPPGLHWPTRRRPTSAAAQQFGWSESLVDADHSPIGCLRQRHVDGTEACQHDQRSSPFRIVSTCTDVFDGFACGRQALAK